MTDQPEPETVQAQHLTPGQWVLTAHPEEEFLVPCRVGYVTHPYTTHGVTCVMVLLTDPTGMPFAEPFPADDELHPATDDEVREAQADGRRQRVVDGLRAAADLIDKHKLPPPAWDGIAVVDYRLNSLDDLHDIADKLDEPITADHLSADSRTCSLPWPNRDDPVIDFYYRDDTGRSYGREVDNGDRPEPVPSGVDGQHVIGRASVVDQGWRDPVTGLISGPLPIQDGR